MGLLSKSLFVALIVLAAVYAYNNVKIDTVTVCVEKISSHLNVTCVEDSDCTKYLTSQYGEYPGTSMYDYLVEEASTCSVGTCEIKDFEFRDECRAGETPIVYRVTAKELVSTI